VLGIVAREVRRKMVSLDPQNKAVIRLNIAPDLAERLRTEQPKGKDKLYAMHAPEVQCIGKGKAEQPYELGAKTRIAVAHRGALVVGARTIPDNPYYGHHLYAQPEQASILLEDFGKQPKQVFVDLGYRGVDTDNPGVEIIHRGKPKSLTHARWSKRRQAPPVIGRIKADHQMARCWLKGAVSDTINAALTVVGYNLHWPMYAMAAGTIKALYFIQILWRWINAIRWTADAAGQMGRGNAPNRDWYLDHRAEFMRSDVTR
jgi:IS5 family transposase